MGPYRTGPVPAAPSAPWKRGSIMMVVSIVVVLLGMTLHLGW